MDLSGIEEAVPLAFGLGRFQRGDEGSPFGLGLAQQIEACPDHLVQITELSLRHGLSREAFLLGGKGHGRHGGQDRGSPPHREAGIARGGLGMSIRKVEGRGAAPKARQDDGKGSGAPLPVRVSRLAGTELPEEVRQLLTGSVGEAVAEAARYAGRALADNTRRAYAADWADFAAWCAAGGAPGSEVGPVGGIGAPRVVGQRPAGVARRLRHRLANRTGEQLTDLLGQFRAGQPADPHRQRRT